MKKPNTIIREYVSRLSSEDLRNLSQRLTQRLFGDYAECAQIMQRDKEMDHLLKTAVDADEWFEIIDMVSEVINKDQKTREETTVEK